MDHSRWHGRNPRFNRSVIFGRFPPPAEKQPGLGEQLTDALQRTEREFRTLPREQRGAQRLFRQMRVAGLRKVCGSRFSSPDRCGQRGQ